MSKKQSIKRHILIINKLKKNASSFEEIKRHLIEKSKLEEENYEISIRTFQRDCLEIASIYNIEIKFNRSTNQYEIEQNEIDNFHERLIESHEIFNALNFSEHISSKIFFEERKSLGTENMQDLLHAIKNEIKISFTHYKYWDETEKTNRTVKPLALKEARNRWYLLALENEKLRTFGIDRISEIKLSNQKTEAFDFNPNEIFNHSFGIIISEKEPQKIILSYSPEQGKYIKSFPLHHSQKAIIDSDEEYRIELLLNPTYDFVMELLSVGAEVKIIEPKNLQDEIKAKLKATLNLYP